MSDLTGGAHENERAEWPEEASGRVVVFLIDSAKSFEEQLLQQRIALSAPPGTRHLYVRLGALDDEWLQRELHDESAWLQPIRALWQTKTNDSGGLRRQLRALRQRAPGARSARRIAQREPHRFVVLAGQGAVLEQVRERFESTWGEAATEASLAEFVTRQALVVLDRAERAARGARYKVSRLLPGDVFANPSFQRQLEGIAEEKDASKALVEAEAARYLHEMAARQTPWTLDLLMALMRAMVRANHEPEIDTVPAQMEQIAELVRTRTVAFVMTHKSMLDSVALQVSLFERNLPTPLTFGGINLNTPGIGALARRAGVIFLRRSFQDNETYKVTFRRYIDYLIEKRFSVLWALEGTRSRTGKLLPPRYGLFNYVVQAILRTALLDVTFVPVNITYDQITEVEDYAIEQKGREKKPEGAGWFVRFLRGGAPHGRIFLRFGEPLTLLDLAPEDQLRGELPEDEQQALVQQVAFETAVRMNQVTPITTTAIVTLILLASGARAQSLASVQRPARAGMALVRRRRLEVVGRTDFKNPEAVRETLEQLEATGVVTFFDDGEERLYGIGEDQHHKAAYYRNTIIHFFVADALIELSLLHAGGVGESEFWDEMYRLRDLFKHEFYFRRRGEFRDNAERLLVQRYPAWRARIDSAEGTREMLSRANPLLSHAVLRSFVDAYRVVAIRLTRLGSLPLDDRRAFVKDCLKLGAQMRLEGRVFSEESVSKSLYETGCRVAEGRGLLQPGDGSTLHTLESGRSDFLEQLRSLRTRLDEVLSFRRDPSD